MSKIYKVITVVLSAALAFFFSWFMNQLTYTYFPPQIAGFIEDGASAVMIMMMLWAMGFFDRPHHM